MKYDVQYEAATMSLQVWMQIQLFYLDIILVFSRLSENENVVAR